MWMRVTRGRLDPAKLDQDATLIQDIAEAFRQLPGYQSYMLGLDRATGQVLTVSTFDTEEHARFTQSRSDFLARFQAIGAQPEPPEFFEVAIQA